MALAGAGAGLVAGALWLRFFLDEGLVDWKIFLCYALVFVGSLIAIQGVCRIWWAGALAASKAPGLYVLVRGMICASFIIAASGLYRNWRFEQELAHHATESRGVVSGHVLKGKGRDYYQRYRFEYAGRTYHGEFSDPKRRLQGGDTVRILHGTQHPEWSRALVDWIYEP